MTQRRAFSLIEVLIVLAIIAAIAIIAWPNLGAWRTRAGVDSATDQVESAIQHCRDHAQTQGVPMRLVARRESSGATSIVLQSTEPGGAVRAVLTLPVAIRISAARPMPTEPTSTPSAETPVEPPAASSEDLLAVDRPHDEAAQSGGEFTLVSALPDGSLVSNGPSYLFHADDQDVGVEITVERWSGRVEIARLTHARQPADPTLSHEAAEPAARHGDGSTDHEGP
jgi:prepilin-type N-terminal cleavage/methylation domain-containing protein